MNMSSASTLATERVNVLPKHGYHHLGVVWEDVTVYGAGDTRRPVESLARAVAKMWDVVGFGARLFNVKLGKKRAILEHATGVVNAGEMLLVLGRPGSGCSTLLRAIANQRDSFAGLQGDVSYGSIDAAEAKRHYDGAIVFNSEEDLHAPVLSVADTLNQALTLKKPHAERVRRSVYAKQQSTRLLEAFGMPHTAETRVGNDYVRGVSGGERKRVSLAEHLTTNAAVSCWDNSIRGLDSAVALHYVKLLKELSQSTGMTNIVSIYQASEEMYALFDRVAVLYKGQLVFYGKASDGRRFFEEQGWHHNPRQSTPDFLTSCTSPTERVAREGCTPPQTPDEMVRYFRESPEYEKLAREIADYKAHHLKSGDTDEFRRAQRRSKEPLTGQANAYTSNFVRQCLVLTRTQFQLQLADPVNLVVSFASNIFNAVIVGAVSYKPPSTTAGSFAIAGDLFFAILYFVIFSFSQIPPTVNGRALLVKHRSLGFFNPAAVTIAMMIADVPLYAVQTLVFSSIFYFLIGLTPTASAFFTFFFICFTNYSTVSVLYRMIGAWSPNLSVAVRYGGFALSIVLTAAGFITPPPQMEGWISWVRRAGPPSYALEALLANEFRHRDLSCSGTSLVPSGAGYTSQACTIAGAQVGTTTVDGLAYLDATYGFQAAHIWRNVGIMWAMYAIYAAMVIVGSSLLIKDTGSAGAKLYASSSRRREGGHAIDDTKAVDMQDKPTFTFKDVEYTIAGKQLLNKVTALVEPGKLTALMGASGAGKTTLLDTVAQRKTTGTVAGEFLVDGKPLPLDFARRAGFVMQGDIHEPFATVRECLEFSALLRQDASVLREDKLRTADEIIELLELGDIADAIVGNPDIGGLGVEERKRLTIGVELAASPDFLLFLDEPTSGLDSQAAFEIVRFLRKIAARGIAILCTIHQPSGDLFELFDSLVLLAPGGRTVYAGPNGTHAAEVTAYFARHGAACPADANPAEFILATCAPVGGSRIDWPALWRESDEARRMEQRIADVSKRGGGAQEDVARHAYAASFKTQTLALIKRNWLSQYRNGSYPLTKISSSVFFGLFMGFWAYQFPATQQRVQSISLVLLALTQVCPPLALDIASNYLDKFSLYLARERNGIYHWTAMVTSLIVVELPVLFVSFTLLFLCYHWTIFGTELPAESGALSWLSWAVLSVWLALFGLVLGSVSPSGFAVPYILSAIWILFNVTSWALVPFSIMSPPFQYFVGWLSPLHWFFGSLMTASLGPLEVTCTSSELATFDPPTGQTCGEYLATFLETASGYLANPEATAGCGYCSMSTGQDYLDELGFEYSHRWRNWGVFLCFTVANIATIFAATWLMRIRPLYK